MRAKRVIAGCGVGGTDTRPAHREAYADDFGGESDALRPGNAVCWAKNFKSSRTGRGPTRGEQNPTC